MKKNYFFNCVFFCVLISHVANAQDSVVMKAMRDELNRNINELTIPGSDKPFFIAYKIEDQHSWTVQGKLGVLQQSRGYHSRRRTSTRLLVGNYAFNDESFDAQSSVPSNRNNIALPEDDDYWGIRRSFWYATEGVYRSATAKYLKHVESLKENNKQLSEVPHKSFAKGTAINRIENLVQARFDTIQLERMMTRLSTLFSKQPDVRNSAATIHYNEGYKYLVNSEGVYVRLPAQQAGFDAYCQTVNKEGAPVLERISFTSRTPDQLPSESDLADGIKDMIARMEVKKDALLLTDTYEGPVLMLGQPVANFLATSLFGREGLDASDYVAPLIGLNFTNRSQQGLDTKIGRNIVHESISIKATPRMMSYQGVDLLASFDVDEEGIEPPKELTLIENGVLKNLLNNRTLTDTIQKNIGFSGHHGVIEFSSKLSFTIEALKDKLLEKAKNEGLEFALIIRQSGKSSGSLTTSKIFVSDKHEEIIQNINIRQGTIKSLKHLLGVTTSSKAYNTDNSASRIDQDMGSNRSFMAGDFQGSSQFSGPVSIIAPEGLLIDQLEIHPEMTAFVKEREYVSAPGK